MTYIAHHRKDGKWRIMLEAPGELRDLCGAVDEHVAWATCQILNAMRRASKPLTSTPPRD